LMRVIIAVYKKQKCIEEPRRSISILEGF